MVDPQLVREGLLVLSRLVGSQTEWRTILADTVDSYFSSLETTNCRFRR